VALLEAMAAGLPVISSDLPGVREAAEHERSALLVRPGDATALAEAVSRLIAEGDTRVRLGAEARRVIEERFLLDDSVRELAGVFQQETALGCGPGWAEADAVASW